VVRAILGKLEFKELQGTEPDVRILSKSHINPDKNINSLLLTIS